MGTVERVVSNPGQGLKTVQWLGASEPPVALVTHLRMRGLFLRAGGPNEPMYSARLLVIEPSTSAVVRGPSLEGRRVAVMHPDPGAADALAQALRAKGAEVVALSLNPESLERAEALDPDVVLMEPADFYGSCWEIVRAVWQHPRLRYATVLLASPEPVGPDGASALDVQNLCVAIQSASSNCDRVRDEARTKDESKFALDVLGPARTLRALLESKRSLRVFFRCPDLTVEVDLSDEIIVGAQGGPGPHLSEAYLGPHALAQLLQQHAGQVEVRAVDHPAATNIMAPFETALHTARESLLASRPSGVRFSAVSINPRAPHPTPRQGWTAPPKSGTAAALPAPTALQKPVSSTVRKTLTPTNLPTLKSAGLPAPMKPLMNVPEPAPANIAARVDNVVTKRKEPAPVVATPSGIPPPNVIAQDSERIVAVAPRPPQPVVVPKLVSPAQPPLKTPVPLEQAITRPIVASSLPDMPLPVDLTVSREGEARYVHAFGNDDDGDEGAPQVPIDTSRYLVLQTLARKRGALVLGVSAALVCLWLGAVALGLLGGTPAPSVATTPPSGKAVAAATGKSELPPTLPNPVETRAPTAEPANQHSSDEPPAEDDLSRRARSRRASALVSQGHSFRKRGLLPTAKVHYLGALREYPGYPRALAGLAQLSIAADEGAQAVGYARKLLQARPTQVDYLVLLGDAYKSAGMLSQARDAWQKAANRGSRTARKRLDANR